MAADDSDESSEDVDEGPPAAVSVVPSVGGALSLTGRVDARHEAFLTRIVPAPVLENGSMFNLTSVTRYPGAMRLLQADADEQNTTCYKSAEPAICEANLDFTGWVMSRAFPQFSMRIIVCLDRPSSEFMMLCRNVCLMGIAAADAAAAANIETLRFMLNALAQDTRSGPLLT